MSRPTPNPKTFEQQTADAIRTLTVIVAVLAVGFVSSLGLAIWGLLSAKSATDAVHAGLVQQTQNRTTNVEVWCSSINGGRDYDRAFVHRATHGRLKYTLRDLPCQALENKTLASTKPHPHKP